ncbi:hypothetical protein K435DRAFT_839360 [Dendrothele bispora CBS 962.96]|uniref:Uncharacterized protein n=1 Tax=Dendrothele bispora (strain CBS 962.96) TaxID=1314807 RepID=A0A4S8M1B3_DENBC|nr:hypothetical protein K435DRAFT_839360 [Dendrothele bispora CBS 962.96]
MKTFTAVLSALSLATVAFAQSAQIGYPTEGTSVTAGSTLNVDIIRPNTISSSEEVGIVLGLSSCNQRACFAPNLTMGTVLYNGDFDPQFGDENQPHQNFTIEIPSDFTKGSAQLNFAHFYLLGASLAPSLENSSVNITIV